MQSLTPREKSLLKFIENYQFEHGASPTVKEMRVYMRLKSDGFVIHCLKQLARKGIIKKDATPRGVRLMDRVAEKLNSTFAKLPVLGTIPAGGPMVSEEYIDEWIGVDESFVGSVDDCFVLKVRGDSMINAGIFEGDYVIASHSQQPKPGDIVVALVDGGSTVKRYMVINGKPYLQAENKNYRDILPESELQIQGVVKALLRSY